MNRAELENKLVNIGDDLGDAPVVKSYKLKQLFDEIESQSENRFVFKPCAKFIFSTNQIPRREESKEGDSHE